MVVICHEGAKTGREFLLRIADWRTCLACFFDRNTGRQVIGFNLGINESHAREIAPFVELIKIF